MMRRAFPAVLFIAIIFLFISASGCINIIPETQDLEPVTDEYYAEMDTVLYPYIQTIDEQMNEITASVWSAARELDGIPADDPALKLALLKLKSEIPLSYEVGRVDTENILIAITGGLNNQQLVGTEIITTPYTEEELRVAGPVCLISDYVTFQNGDRGIKVIAPVYDAQGNFDGTLQVSLNVESLFAGAAQKLRMEYGYSVWVAQQNGILIFDEGTPEIGSELTSASQEYSPSFTTAIKNILENTSGHISYISYTVDWHNISQTNTVWNTVYPGFGQEWRVVLVDNAPKPHELMENVITQEELKAFVVNAFIYAQKVGREKALAAFNDPNGEFIDGELYIFAGKMDGTVLSAPYQPVLVGKNAWFTEDAAGVKYVQRVIARAQQGGGYVYYLYPNPDANYASELKLSYVMPIDNEWYIGAGIYEHYSAYSHTVGVDWQTRNELIKQVRTMTYLAEINGIPAVTEMMMDPTSEFQRDGLYPFAITGNGTILAFFNAPDLVGTNQLGTVNSYGMSFVREGISLGADGGGLMYTLAWDAGRQKEVYVLDYVEPVGNDTYFASYMILE